MSGKDRRKKVNITVVGREMEVRDWQRGVERKREGREIERRVGGRQG